MTVSAIIGLSDVGDVDVPKNNIYIRVTVSSIAYRISSTLLPCLIHVNSL